MPDDGNINEPLCAGAIFQPNTTMKPSIKLGNYYTDSVTGFQGVAIASIEYLTGCTQYQLQPKIDKDGKIPDAQWFDENRLSANAKSNGGPAPTSLPGFGR